MKQGKNLETPNRRKRGKNVPGKTNSLLDYFLNECNADRVKMAIVDKFWLNIAERNCL